MTSQFGNIIEKIAHQFECEFYTADIARILEDEYFINETALNDSKIRYHLKRIGTSSREVSMHYGHAKLYKVIR